jgi:serine protease inhibitor
MNVTLRSRCAMVLALLLLAAALPLVMVACGDESTETGGTATTAPTETTTPTASTDPDGISVAMSGVSRLTSAAPRTDVDAAAGSMQAFGADLYSVLAEQAGTGNLVFSPASIVTALAMTYAGAAGTTAEEMAATLHFSLAGDTLHQAFNSLDTALESRGWEGQNSEGAAEGVLLKTANSLWAQQDLTFEQLFLDTLAANYGAGVRLVDYKTAAEEARQAINEWVAGETNDKIPELIPGGMLDALTRLVLVNAVYLDATWANQFDPEATTDLPFTTLGGETVTTPMMVQSMTFPYADGDGWQAVELPYLRDELAMLVIVPDEGSFTEVESTLRSDLIDNAVARLTEGVQVSLVLPKFEFRTQAGLNDALAALGMPSAFDPGTADFSGMTLQEKLYISDVVHEAYIAVDEEGTEAAAATAVVMRLTAAPAEIVELTIDRPFIFALRDRETGAILFLGRVTDPTA